MWDCGRTRFSEAQLTRALIAAESAGIQVCIVLNKIDLPGQTPPASVWPLPSHGLRCSNCP